MADNPNKMFRKAALEQLSTPEQLDQLLKVVNRKSWIPIMVLGGGLLLAITWSIWGRIPIAIDGEGILLFPHQVVTFQMPAAGQIVSLSVQVGDRIEKGQVLGRINQPEIQARLEHERLRLAGQLERNRDLDRLSKQRLDLERQAIALQRENLLQLKGENRRLANALKKRHEAYQRLRKDGLTTDELVLGARSRLINGQMQVSDVNLKLQGLDIRSAALEQRETEAKSDAELAIHELQRNIARLEGELKRQAEIRSEHAGRILEVAAAVGQLLPAGHRLGSIETADADGKLVALAFFPVRLGKKLLPGMEIRIAPTTVQRERFGSIVGTVGTVSRFPVSTDAVTNAIGNSEVARNLTSSGSRIQVSCDLSRDESTKTGFQWTSGRGPDQRITAGTTVMARAIVEYRRPITFVIPILRRWSGT